MRPSPLRRLHDWLLRRRLVREQKWGQPSLTQALLRIRFLSAVLLAMPALVLCAWYLFIAWAAYLGHESETHANEPLSLRLFQLHLHDKLARDLRRLTIPEPRKKSALPTYGLVISNDKLDQLASRLPPDDGQPYYVDAKLVKRSRGLSVQVSYRGGKYWHFNHPQKSWKVRVKDGGLFDGLNTFNFINTPEAVPFEEEIILDVAREMGLITPDYFPFRLLINKAYTGVYFFEAHPDEGVLRRAQRPFGAIYSGSDSTVDASAGISALFKSADNFTNVTQDVHQSLGEHRELESLIDEINRAGAQEFARYAEQHLDLNRFAQWDALDVVFGCNQHDLSENHKLYFDPYRGRFEPIAWNFRGCKREPEFNRTENPLLLRLKQLPDYVSRRNRIVYELMQDAASTKSLRERIRRLLDKLEEDQERDPYWDAFQLLPTINPYYSSLLRPVNRHIQDIAIDTRLFELEERQRLLNEALERNDCRVELTPGSLLAPSDRQGQKNAEYSSLVDVSVGGGAGFAITQFEASWPGGCKEGSWHLFADTDLSGTLDPTQDRDLGQLPIVAGAISTSVELYPGSVFEERSLQVQRGSIQVRPEPRTYRFFVQSRFCQPAGMKIRARNLVTLSTLELSARFKAASASLRLPPEHCDDKYSDGPRQSSPHPWCYKRLPHETIRLGPGIVDIDQMRVYAQHQSVELAAGTTLRMAAGASLVFMGKVTARGTSTAPIRFVPKDRQWGGIALQGQDCSGSDLEFVEIRNGTQPSSDTLYWPGLLNLHDIRDVRIDHCTIADNRGSSVALHVGESQNINLTNISVRNSPNTALALEYSTVNLDGLTIVKAGGDALDIFATRANIRNSKILEWAGSGIVASKRSELSLEDVVLARGNHGLLVHDASVVQYERLLLFDNHDCVHVDAVNDAYGGRSRMGGANLFAIDCKEPIGKGSRRPKDIGKVNDRLMPDDLVNLRRQVLNISDWSQLPAKVASLANGDAS